MSALLEQDSKHVVSHFHREIFAEQERRRRFFLDFLGYWERDEGMLGGVASEQTHPHLHPRPPCHPLRHRLHAVSFRARPPNRQYRGLVCADLFLHATR